MARTTSPHHTHDAATTRDDHLTLMTDLFAMLSDPSRLRILMCLQDHDEVCVTDLSESSGVSESAVSHALRLLRAHSIVTSRRDGRWIFYSLADEHVRVLLTQRPNISNATTISARDDPNLRTRA